MELAPYCSDDDVAAWLAAKEATKLAAFLRRRHEARFFNPIEYLRRAPDTYGGYGFSMMALCCLLIETIECYRRGIPTTSKKEWSGLAKIQQKETVLTPFQLPTQGPPKGSEVFETFFRDFQSLFPNVDGKAFYENIRNGILHQAQTKGGWTINARGALCAGKNINRNLFAKALEKAFDSYTAGLQEKAEQKTWNKDWENAARKIWWLIRISRG